MVKYARANPARWWRTRGVGVGGGVHRSPAAMFISPLRRFSMMFVLGMLILLIVGVWYLTNPKRISRLAQILLSNVLGGKVEVKSGRLSLAGTLELTGVVVHSKNDPVAPELFSADQVKVRFDWLSLLVGDLRATQITATRPTLTLVEDLGSQTWNYQGFRQQKSAAGPVGGGETKGEMAIAALPVILLREARVQWGELEQGKFQVTGSAVIDGQLSPTAGAARLYQYTIDQRLEAAEGVEKLPEAGGGGQELELGHIQGTWDLEGNRFTAITSPWQLGPVLLQAMPRQARLWCQAHQLAGELRRLQVSYDPDHGLNLSVEVAKVAMTQSLNDLAPLLNDVMPELTHPVVVGLEEVSGEIAYVAKENRVDVRHLRGQIIKQKFQVEGFALLGKNEPLDFRLSMPTTVFTQDYPDVFMAFYQTRDLVYRLRPRGKFDIGVHLFRNSGMRDLGVEGVVNCQDVEARFIHFAYPMHGVNGRVRFDDKYVYFDGVTALADENPVTLNGYVGVGSSDKTINMTVSSEGVYVDDRLALCLPERFLPIWQQFDPRGLMAFSCVVTHGPKYDDEQHVTVHVLPKDVEAMYGATPPTNYWYPVNDLPKELKAIYGVLPAPDTGGSWHTQWLNAGVENRGFPVRMKHLQGDFLIQDEETTIKLLSARVGSDESGSLTLAGKVLYPEGNMDKVDVQLAITARQVPLEPALLRALPEEHQSWTEQVNLTGRMNFDGKVARPEGEVLVNGTIGLSEATVAAAAGAGQKVPWQFGKINAMAEISPQVIKIERLVGRTGSDGECVVNLQGSLDRRGLDQLDYQLKGDWQELHLDPKVSSMLPPQLAALWTEYRPSGALDGRFSVRGSIPISNEPPGDAPVAATAPMTVVGEEGKRGVAGLKVVQDYRVDLEPHGLKLAPEFWPDTVSEVRGRLQLTPGKLVLEKIAGESGPAQLEISGTYQGELQHLDLTGKLTAKTLPVKWIGLLPKDLASFVTEMKPEGSMSVDLRRLSWQGEPGTGAVTQPGATLPAGPLPGWDFNGSVVVESMATEGPLISKVKNLRVNGVGAWRSNQGGDQVEGLELEGTLEAQTFALAGKPITDLKGRLESKLGQSMLEIKDIDGKVADGSIHGQVQIQTDKNPGYQTSFVLNDAELASLLLQPGASAEERKRIGTGRVTANLAVQEKFGDRGTRTGRGDLVVRNGTIYNVPLSMGLMQVVTLRLPVSKAFNKAQMSYYIRDNKVTFEKILLQSDGFNLAGLGTLTLADRQLDMRLVTDSASEVKIPLFDWVRGQIMQLQITGPVEAPSIVPIPLDAVSSTLLRLLPQTNVENKVENKPKKKGWFD